MMRKNSERVCVGSKEGWRRQRQQSGTKDSGKFEFEAQLESAALARVLTPAGEKENRRRFKCT